MREQSGVFREPGPLDAIEYGVGELRNRFVVKMLLAGEDAAEEDRGIDRRYLRVPHSFTGVDIGEVIEESAMSGQFVPQERQALDYALARLGVTYKAAHFPDTDGGEAEAGGRDTRNSACVFGADVAAIFGQSGWRAGLFPEEEEAAVLKIVQELLILW